MYYGMEIWKWVRTQLTSISDKFIFIDDHDIQICKNVKLDDSLTSLKFFFLDINVYSVFDQN